MSANKLRKELGTIEARQGNRRRLNFRVLIISMTLVVVAAAIVLVVW